MNSKEYFFHPTICPVPWTGLYLGPSGDIRNCSISGRELGNINDAPIDTILNSIENQTLKTDLLNKVKNNDCTACWQMESLQENSNKNTSNRSHFKKTIKIPLSIFNSPTNYELKQVDLRWKNSCNLACVYCNSDLSSSWAAELNQTVTIDESALLAFKNYIFSRIKEIQYVYLCGGEPLLMKENLELIQLIKKENPDIYIRVNTNLTNINSPIYASLLECKNVHWIISVESTKEYFEYIRYGAKWDSWFKNLTQLNATVIPLGHKITFNMVWCSLTAFEIFNTIDLLMSSGFHENSFIVQPLTDPESLLLDHLTPKIIDELKTELNKRLLAASEHFLLSKNYQVMLTHLNSLSSDRNPTILKEYLLELDSRRFTNGVDLFSNLV